MNMSSPAQYSVSELNRDLDTHFSRDRTNDYDRVVCLIIYWACAQTDYKKEAVQVQSFFTSKLGYRADLYEIPLLEKNGSHLAVDNRIHRLVESLQEPRSLAIIHYGGHGDDDLEKDEKGRRPRRSVWAARSELNSPKVYWSDIQPRLRYVNGHVLLILDCCFAAQAARVGNDRIIPPNVEMVAACAMGVMTVSPGEESFTSKWLEEAGDQLKRNKHIRVSEIHDALPNRDKGVMETPLHWGLSDGSIRLDPLPKANSSSLTPKGSSGGALTLRILTQSPLDESTMDAILFWLKNEAPRGIASVRIEELTTLTSQLRGFVLEDKECARSVAAIHTLTEKSQIEVRSTWDTFKIRLVSAVQSLAAGLLIERSQDETSDDILAREFLNNYEKNLQALQRVVQRGVLSHPQLDDQLFLASAIEDMTLKDLNIVAILRARLHANFEGSVSPTLEKRPPKTRFQGSPDFRVPLHMEDRPDFNGIVLVEYKPYERIEPGSITLCERRVAQLATVLKDSEPSTFHTPQCLGWFHEKGEQCFGLIFRPPRADFRRPVSLREILESPNPVPGSKERPPKGAEKYRKPDLGERFDIARKICKAVIQWHSAGWLHQGIASHNVVFLQAADGSLRYNEPFLCGFEFSREHNELSRDMLSYKLELDVYLHPDRQGRPPKKKHTQDHDYYCLGLLFSEIAMWDYVPNILHKYIDKKGAGIVQDKMRSAMKGMLRHSMGTAYEQATILCLEANFTPGAGSAKNGVVEEFEKSVLTRIEADPTQELYSR
jgi:hypothetical protein